MYDNNGFLISEDNADSYLRSSYSGTLLILTNKPIPVPQPAPEPVPSDWDLMAEAIKEGVNEI